MGKRTWIGFMLLFVVAGFLLTASCAKPVVKSEPAITDSEVEMIAQRASETARQEEIAKQRALDALEAKRLQEERELMARKKAAAERQAEAAARRLFQDEDIYYDFDSSALQADAEDVLKRKAEWLRNNPGVSAIIEGHCDERGTNEYNLALGDRRAESAKLYLVNLGIDAARLTSISYGEERPVNLGQDEGAWAKNRRAHWVID